ncbi:adenosylmethionine---8-amino-7-oxononanoate aminotransferase [Mariprofundus micogutta]|uniref:Adenosylmethionine-8-amino-7-oxononanoate aminotransferase n=1 Tax=Mariprofundus micogutta TaxID=1921010 RepID=A0A1L8CKX6_9PROT|nr:adenosylmethionine--8-amino-7-oxononanoate transaminase [Mariprofundus micogutta]GAV19564.1 adenosylmethionine---8-amino-7-oxononanoate aminotransferase [Mariprofundus micogutta]
MSWLDFESQHVWHPYASMLNPGPVYPVKRAEGVFLEFEDGTRVIDGMSSWWCAIHGYNVPELNAALLEQSSKMSHVMFGGLTHKPAAELAKRLLSLAPANMSHVFFSDSGSVSVEVAIKMALQYWQAKSCPEKHRLLTIRSGYHGDTFGAMSVCDPESGMHHLFSGVLAQQLFADRPAATNDDEWDESQIAAFESRIKTHHHELAAVILEPIVQGAGGMRFYAPEFLRRVRLLCDEYDVLLIIDEIATGFGRTGTMFACEQAGINPDIMCVGKALTGGYLSLAATLCSAAVCGGIHADSNDEQSGVLMHGPTFMANPLACAVAVASIDLLLASAWQQRVLDIEVQLKEELEPCRGFDSVADVRVKGAIGVLEMKESVDVANVQRLLIEQGVWLRPFGKLLYTMPPFVIRPAQLGTLTSAMKQVCGQI